MKEKITAILLCLFMMLSLLSTTASGNVLEEEDGSGLVLCDTEEFTVGAITLRTKSGKTLQEVPDGDSIATVSVTGKKARKNVAVFLACYTNQKQFIGYERQTVENLPANETVKVNISVDNAKGSIVFLKAFATASASDLTPLGKAAVFGTAVVDPQPGEHELPIDVN